MHRILSTTVLICAILVTWSALLAQTTVSILNSSTGTTTNRLSCLDSSGKAVNCPASAVGVIGVCVTGCGTSGSASIAVAGSAGCAFDGSTTAGDYVVPSSTSGECTDAGQTYPSTGVNLVGRVPTTNTGSGTYTIVITPPELRPGVPAGTSSTQYGAAYAASSTANDLSFTTAGATGTVLAGATAAPPTFSSNVSVSGYLQVTGSSPGCLHLESGSSDSEICANASTGNWTLTLPTSGGTSGYPLVTNGSGSTSWSQLGNSALNLTSPLTASIDLGTVNFEAIEIANSVTGTTLNKLAKLTGAPSAAVITATTDTGGAVGVVVGGAGTSGNAQIAQSGTASCTFDGSTTAGDYVQISSITAGDCSDAGVTRPTASQILGRVLSSNGSGGTYAMTVWTGVTGSIGTLYGLSGDLGGTLAAAVVEKVDGVTYPASPGTNTVPVVTGSNTVTYEAVPNGALANSSVTVAAGNNLSGGGPVSLGSATTLSLANPLTANIDLGTSYAEVIDIQNDSTTGTTMNKLAKLTGSPSTAVIMATTDIGAAVGVVVGGAGTSGSAQIAQSGIASCTFDTSTTAGAAAGKFSDTTDTVTLAAGDEISVQAKNNASSTSALVADMSALLTP